MKSQTKSSKKKVNKKKSSKSRKLRKLLCSKDQRKLLMIHNSMRILHTTPKLAWLMSPQTVTRWTDLVRTTKSGKDWFSVVQKSSLTKLKSKHLKISGLIAHKIITLSQIATMMRIDFCSDIFKITNGKLTYRGKMWKTTTNGELTTCPKNLLFTNHTCNQVSSILKAGIKDTDQSLCLIVKDCSISRLREKE
jgi:hypothetical protein